MLVSVVVITYNSAQFVLETLESIAAQTYREMELIITDDCSKDNTVELCRNWLGQHKERFIRSEILTVDKNTGIAGNCNRGYGAAHGEWIKGIAGDDLLEVNCIGRFVEFSQKHPEHIFLSYLQEFGASSKINKPKPTFEKASTERQLNMVLSDGLYVCAPSCFCKKTLWESVGGFDEHYPLFEDFPFFVNILLAKERIGIIPEILVRYRVHSASISRNDGYSGDCRTWRKNILIPLQRRHGHYLAYWHTNLTLWRTDPETPLWLTGYPMYALWLLLDPLALCERVAYRFSK